MICYIIEYSTSIIKRNISEMLKIFNYKYNITIIITKSENIKDKRKEDIKPIIIKNLNLIISFLQDWKKIRTSSKNIKRNYN